MAWSMLAIFVISLVAALILAVANGTFQQDAGTQLLLVLGFSAFMVVGALVVAHRPGNAIGWLFSAIALLAVTGQMASEYAIYAYATRPGSRPGATLAAWYGSWPWWLVLTLTLVFTPLLFPTGRLLSPRWRPVAWLAGMAAAVTTALTSLQPELEAAPGQVIANPIGVTALGDPEESPVVPVLIVLLVVLAAVAFGSLVLRFRRSRGEERQQLKWFTYASALLPLAVLSDFLPAPVGDLLLAILIGFLPVATGIAILRHRLYDIDRLINRTLVYGLLTVLLAGIYAGAVLVLGQLFGEVGGDPPRWAVAGATLAVAALFQPTRRRIQAVVDRRFNRRKYDAAIRLHEGVALVSSRRRMDDWQGNATTEVPGQVEVWSYGDEVYGDIDGDGRDEAVVPLWYTNGGGTGGGQLGQGLAIMSGVAGKVSSLGIARTTQDPVATMRTSLPRRPAGPSCRPGTADLVRSSRIRHHALVSDKGFTDSRVV